MDSNQIRRNYRFPLWITVIFLLLILIPVSIVSNVIVLAKISGVLCLLTVVFAMRFWFRVAKQNAGHQDRVVINYNDWFDLQRTYPCIKQWEKSDIRALKDRIGILLASVEFRKTKNELSSRAEAIQQAFQYAVFYWGEEYPNMEDTYLYIDGDNHLVFSSVSNHEDSKKLTLGFDQSFSSVNDLHAHYHSLNTMQD